MRGRDGRDPWVAGVKVGATQPHIQAYHMYTQSSTLTQVKQIISTGLNDGKKTSV